MGIIRSGMAIGMLALSFYGGMKYQQVKEPQAQHLTIEEKIKSLINDDKEQVMKALYRVGKEMGYEK